MASIIKKNIRGRPYYYARECKRVEGKPKIVWQKYLGRAENIIAAVSGDRVQPPMPAKPTEALVSEFGAVVALYDLARRLRLVEHIDRHVPKQGRGPTVGAYLLVAILNRCVAPCSKTGIAQWFQETALRRLVDIEARQLSSQRFWDNMDRISREAIEAIEKDIVSQMVREFEIDVKRVLFDATNFFTFIDTFNESSTLAQRGKSKEGRRALAHRGAGPVGVGRLPCAPAAPHLSGQPTRRPHLSRVSPPRSLRGTGTSPTAPSTSRSSLTKGNNSQDNLGGGRGQVPTTFIGSLVPTQHPELLQIPRQVASVPSMPKTACPESRSIGPRREALWQSNAPCWSPTTTTSSWHNRGPCCARLPSGSNGCGSCNSNCCRRWHTGQVRGGKPPTVDSVTKKAQGLAAGPPYERDLFKVDSRRARGPAHPDLPLRPPRLGASSRGPCSGKTLLFTDNDDWADAEIVRGYRAQHHVETGFRCMKDPYHICLRPQHHWTDQKIEVHVFCCVLALLLCSLLRRELHQQGIDRSIADLLEQLGNIREVGIVYPSQDKRRPPTLQMTLSRMSEEQRAIYSALDLERYLAA